MSMTAKFEVGDVIKITNTRGYGFVIQGTVEDIDLDGDVYFYGIDDLFDISDQTNKFELISKGVKASVGDSYTEAWGSRLVYVGTPADKPWLFTPATGPFVRVADSAAREKLSKNNWRQDT